MPMTVPKQMPQQTIYLLRHGEIEPPGPNCLIGQMDLPLSRKGVKQAGKWRKVFASIAFDRIYCSDLERTKSTARIIACGRKTDIVQMPGLREIDLGSWDGLTREEIQRRFPGAWERRGRDLADYRPEAGESFSDLSGRVIPLFVNVVNAGGAYVLFVTHAGVIRVIIAHILSMPIQNILSLRVAYGSAYVVVINDSTCSLQAAGVFPENFLPGFSA